MLILVIKLICMSESLSQAPVSEDISEAIFPFSIAVDPMERLLLVNFEQDPDSIYLGFEPQVFDDPINGSGHLIIGWRNDKKVDVYHQKTLNPDPAKYSITGAGLHQMIPVEMDKAFYEVNEQGVQAHYLFEDMQQRRVEIFIAERNEAERKPFGLLAPMGDAALNPASMPLVLLHDFYFVRSQHSDIKLSIDGRDHKLDELPMRMDGQKMTFARYSPKPLIAALNAEYKGLLEPISMADRKNTISAGDAEYRLQWKSNEPQLEAMIVANDIYPITMDFSPAFPSVNAISHGKRVRGRFAISGHESVGRIQGKYFAQQQGDSLHVRLQASQGWKPKSTKFSTWFLFTFARVFKKWPSTYQWDAHLRQDKSGDWHMESKWTRTGKILKD